MDPRFGRCPYFIIMDTETMEFQAIENQSAMASGGAGVQAAQATASLGVEAVITGNVGPKAFQTLSAAGIKIITGASGMVKDVVEKFKTGGLVETTAPTADSHAGMGGGMGGGRRAGGR